MTDSARPPERVSVPRLGITGEIRNDPIGKEANRVLRELLEEWEAASEIGWARPLTEIEARVVLAALSEVYFVRDSRRYHRG